MFFFNFHIIATYITCKCHQLGSLLHTANVKYNCFSGVEWKIDVSRHQKKDSCEKIGMRQEAETSLNQLTFISSSPLSELQARIVGTEFSRVELCIRGWRIVIGGAMGPLFICITGR